MDILVVEKCLVVEVPWKDHSQHGPASWLPDVFNDQD